MLSLYEEYRHLWPANRQESLRDILKDVYCIHFPKETEAMLWANKKKTIIIIEKGKDANFTRFFREGFEHVLFQEREDFPQELLASALMVTRPEVFSKNPLPFFFTGFRAPDLAAESDQSLILDFNQSDQKNQLKDSLQAFMKAIPGVRFASDLAIQVADEMITNVLFNAPINDAGQRTFASLSRDVKIILPESKKARLFACFSDKRIILGCEDPFGSLQRDQVLKRWIQIYDPDQEQVLAGQTGSGLGMKLMIDYAANFYVYSEYKKKTLVACAFLLGGLKANMTSAKHIHFSVH